MLNIILCVLALQPAIFCTGWFLKDVVRVRKPLTYTLLTSVLVNVGWVLNNLILPERNIFLEILMYPAIYFTCLMIYVDPAQRLRALLVQALYIYTPTVASLVMGMMILPIIRYTGADARDFLDMQGRYYPWISLLINTACVFFLWGESRILSLLLQPAKESRSLLWFLFIPLSQIVLVTMYGNFFFLGSQYSGELSSFIFAVLLCIASDIVCIIGFRKYSRLQKAARELEETRHQLQLQTDYYRNLQTDILRINNIRHDLKNQLQSALYLMKQGNTPEADRQLELLNRELCKKVGSRYSENLMVDAVLTEKARACEEKNIRLLISAPVPQQVRIESAYLCSAFSNLLDNAVEGTLHSGHPEGPIDLSCDIQGPYLTISCKNPGNQPREKKNTDLLRPHGLGLDILREISRKYDGSFHTDWKDGIFQANLILKI